MLATLAACANAAASVLQRKANRDQSSADNLSWRLIGDLLHQPVWFAGIVAVTAGFLLQATALGHGQLAVVEPILVAELPFTLILGSRVFRVRLGLREWSSAVTMTLALAGMLYLLSPTAGHQLRVGWLGWVLGTGATLGGVAALVAAASRQEGPRRAALLGLATGTTFGLTAAFMKGMTNTFSHGLGALFSTWDVYAMIATGALGMFLLQSAMNAGRLLAAQPGITLADPIVAMLWGTLAFGEHTRAGVYLGLAVLAGLVMAASVVALSHSPLLQDRPAPARAERQGAGAAAPGGT